jgi:hypothetical protein
LVQRSARAGEERREGGGRAHIYGELGAHPGELPRVRRDLLDATGMGLADLDGISPQRIDDLQVLLEHIRVLVILGGDVLLDGGGEGEAGGLAEG